MKKDMAGRPPKDDKKSKRWILLNNEEYQAVRVRADELGMSFSAYVRKLIQQDIELGDWKK